MAARLSTRSSTTQSEGFNGSRAANKRSRMIAENLLQRAALAADSGARVVFWGETNSYVLPEDEPWLMDRAARLAREKGVSDLSAIVRRLGGVPAESRDVAGFLIEGFTAVRSVTGTGGVLSAMRVNEMVTNAGYEKAARNQASSSDVRWLIEWNYQDEKRHLSWIERSLNRTS